MTYSTAAAPYPTNYAKVYCCELPTVSVHYIDDLVTLYHGSCVEVMRELPEASVEGFQVISIELTDEYLPLIMKRITKPIEQVLL